MTDTIIKIGQLWRLKDKIVRSAVKKFAKEERTLVDYEIEAMHRMAFEIKFIVIAIDQDDIDKTKCFVTVEDVNNIVLTSPTKIFIGALLKEFELDEFNA